MDVKGRGDVDIETMKGMRTFDNVLYVLEINQNLMSVGQLLEECHSLSFINNICTIKDDQGITLFSARMNNGSLSLEWENTREYEHC